MRWLLVIGAALLTLGALGLWAMHAFGEAFGEELGRQWHAQFVVPGQAFVAGSAIVSCGQLPTEELAWLWYLEGVSAHAMVEARGE